MKWLPLLLLAFGHELVNAAKGKLYERLLGRSRFNTTQEIENFLLNLQTLNELQSQLFGYPEIAADPDGKAFLDGVANAEPLRPDMQPYLFEGDMILTDSQMRRIISDTRKQLVEKNGQKGKNKITKTRDPRSLTSETIKRWTFPIAYFIERPVNASAVRAGIAKWEEQTCATFRKYPIEPRGRPSLRFIGDIDECKSYVGQISTRGSWGPQEVTIGPSCVDLGTVTHEIGHALGFYHEQSRPERDDFVSIQKGNILCTDRKNCFRREFTMQRPGTAVNYGVRYDYGSVMHYGSYDFSFDEYRRKTVVTKDSLYQSTIGQREEPSFADVKQINFAYCNSSCAGKAEPACQNGGYQDPKNCTVCRCPKGLAGTLCTEVAPSLSASCGQDDLVATINAQTLTIADNKDCNYRITAPAGRKVYVAFSTITFPPSGYFPPPPCTGSYAEIKFSSNLEVSGARICNSMQPPSVTSEGQVMLILFKGSPFSKLSFTYRFDPATPVESTPAPGTTTTPDPVPGTSTTPTITTPQPTPITTQPITTTTTTERPVTPCIGGGGGGGGDCEWTDCTAECGGGIRTQTCNFRNEGKYCNMGPCRGYYPCQKLFRFSRSQGQCVPEGWGGNGGYEEYGGSEEVDSSESPFYHDDSEEYDDGRGGRGVGGRGRGVQRDHASDTKGPFLWSIPVKGAPESVRAEGVLFSETPKNADKIGPEGSGDTA